MQRWAILPVVVLVRTSVIYKTMIIEVSCRFFKVYLTKTHDDIVTQTQGPCSSLQIRTPQEGWNIRDNVLDVKQAHRKDRYGQVYFVRTPPCLASSQGHRPARD